MHASNWKIVRYRLGASFLSCNLPWMNGRMLERRCPCSSCSSFGLSGKQASGREYTLSLQGLGLCCGLRSSCLDPFMLSWGLQPRNLAKLLKQPSKGFWERDRDHLLITPTSASVIRQKWSDSYSYLVNCSLLALEFCYLAITSFLT